MSARAAAINDAFSSDGRNALSKPLSETVHSSSNEKSRCSRRVHVLVRERRAAHQAIVGVQHDVRARVEIAAKRMRLVRVRRARLHVTRQADLERDALLGHVAR